MADYPFIGNIGSIPADLGQAPGRGQREPKGRKPPAGNLTTPADSADDYPPAPLVEPTASLVETLDRLRATHEVASSEETTRRHLVGQRYYHRTPPTTVEGMDALKGKDGVEPGDA